ncbi:MAG: DUF2177 family protein [Actinobacteria bacterium]|nr:DUF2177 family protein [Actinomycetota bacterium]
MTALLILIALPVFFTVDLVWLGLVARTFYRRQMGALLRPTTNWVAAVAFYAVFVAGLVVLVTAPAYDAGSWGDALWRGAVFGFVTYATYDLTNLATLRDWPVPMTFADLAWGTVLAASVSTATYGLATAFGV